MKNGKEYCHSIHQQINDLLQKAHVGVNERVILDKLGFGTMIIFSRNFILRFYAIRNFITGFTRCI
jgi:hypothetical protein